MSEPGSNRISATYGTSRALIVGINEYEIAGPLGYAVSDAEAVAGLLVDEFGFDSKHVRLLLNSEATREAIRRDFMAYVDEGTNVNDRVVFFFAGHGHTFRARRGEVGYLVPSDGDPEDLSTLMRWDTLTRDSDLIRAKHLLFIMDACYGGLAVQRSFSPGSMRFLKDMMLRRSRQVLTAGKADELVADLGGPLPDHSVFTGHLLEGLKGNAAKDGVITANGLMYYVYRMVGRDAGSRQTPHYGSLDGDGDFIFSAPEFDEDEDAEAKSAGDATLINVSAELPGHEDEHMDVVGQVKEALSDEKHRIRLFELVAGETRRAISNTGVDRFPVSERGWSEEEFIDRLERYEQEVHELLTVQALLGYWADSKNRQVLVLPATRLCQSLDVDGGFTHWVHLRWYPTLLLLYAAGVAAVAAGRLDNLEAVLHAPVGMPSRSNTQAPLVGATIKALNDFSDSFKHLPGYERYYTPRSEYLYSLLQPVLDDLFFLGTDYDSAFNTFEFIMAMDHAVWYRREHGRAVAPIGRFGYLINRDDNNPVARALKDSEELGQAWPPLQAGLMGGNLEEFKAAADEYLGVVSRRSWV